MKLGRELYRGPPRMGSRVGSLVAIDIRASSRAPRSGISRALLMVLAALILIGAPLTDPAVVEGASLKDQIASARKRQQSLTKSIAKQESLLNSLAREQSATKDALAATAAQLQGINVDQKKVAARIVKTEASLDRAQARYDGLLDELRQTDFTLGLLEQELLSGEDDLKARREALGQRLLEAYRAESTTLLEQVFTAESFSDVLNDASAYLAYGDQDAQLAEEITSDQQALDTLRLLTTSTRLQTDKLRRDTEDTKAEIRSRRAELKGQKRALKRLEKKTEKIKAAQQARYRSLVKNEKEARARRNTLARARTSIRNAIRSKIASARSRASSLSGDRPGGFDWPTRGSISGNYGCSSFRWYPIRNGCPWHDGIDIAGNPGQPIWAAKDGVVVFSGRRADGAYVVVIVHADGFETTYGHMQPNLRVRSGNSVRKKQVIGYMGCTGFCTGTHLHWEVSRNLVTVNPRAYL